jgi:sorbitol-specific phosphotransferase system component IIC
MYKRDIKAMDVTEIMDNNIFIGLFGLTFSQLMSMASDVLGVLVAFATLIYLIIKIVKLLKNKEKA